MLLVFCACVRLLLYMCSCRLVTRANPQPIPTLLCLCLPVLQGLSASVQACLPHWTFHIPDVLIRPVPRKLEAPMLPWADEGAALAPVLRDVITRVHMEATGRNNDPCVILKGWHWNPDMAVVVAQALPAPGPGVRTFEIDTKALTDDVLGGVLCLGAHVNKVHAKTFKLLTDQHANAPWPWQHLVINDRVTLPMLMGLPRPAEGQRPHLRVHELVLQYDIAEVRMMVESHTYTRTQTQTHVDMRPASTLHPPEQHCSQ